MRRSPVLVLVGFGAAALCACLAACGSGSSAVQAAPSGSAGGTTTAAVPSTSAPVTAASTSALPVASASTSARSVPAIIAAPRPAAAQRSSSPLPFATPQAAMHYLTSAYNRHDATAMRAVTTPVARQALVEMYGEAVNLRLDRCDRQPAGDYYCSFTHDYPRAMGRKPTEHGEAMFTVAPALRPGWYMTVLQTCG